MYVIAVAISGRCRRSSKSLLIDPVVATGSNYGCIYTYPDRSGYPNVPAPDRPSVNTKTIEMYAIWSNMLRYLELFENDFKGGSSGCPGALRTRVNGASGYPDVTAHALRGFLRH